MSEDIERGVKSEAFRQGLDVYIIYSFEDVAFYWNHLTGVVKRRFKSTGNESEVPQSNRLFTDAQLYGRLGSSEEYDDY